MSSAAATMRIEERRTQSQKDPWQSSAACISSLNMAASPTLLFVIVGRNEPLYEAEFHKRGAAGTSDAVTRQNYFVLHSALDLVERAAWTTSNMYLKVVDKVNHQQVSTFLTASNIKLMLLHSGRNEEALRHFFQEVYELYVKVRVLALERVCI